MKLHTFVWRDTLSKNERKLKHTFVPFTAGPDIEASPLKHIKEHIFENGWMLVEHRLRHFDLDADLDWNEYPDIVNFLTKSLKEF